jgi:hypothetical protein
MEPLLAEPLLAASASRRSKLQDRKTPHRVVDQSYPARVSWRKTECEWRIFCEFSDGLALKGLRGARNSFLPGDQTTAP